jgi:hypothetical protein
MCRSNSFPGLTEKGWAVIILGRQYQNTLGGSGRNAEYVHDDRATWGLPGRSSGSGSRRNPGASIHRYTLTYPTEENHDKTFQQDGLGCRNLFAVCNRDVAALGFGASDEHRSIDDRLDHDHEEVEKEEIHQRHGCGERSNGGQRRHLRHDLHQEEPQEEDGRDRRSVGSRLDRGDRIERGSHRLDRNYDQEEQEEQSSSH